MNDRSRYGKIDSVGGEVLTPGDSGIIDKNVEFRELFPDASREGIDGARIFNVELHAAHTGVGGGDLVEENLTATGDDDLIAALMENLGKGAAGQAVQNMNLMLGCPEQLGLDLVPMLP